MKESFTYAQMREADERTIAGGISAKELMERAGRALADAVRAAMDRLGYGDAMFVCGGGNNGGDGFVAARILHEEGREVGVLCMATSFSEECRVAKERYTGRRTNRMDRRRYGIVVDCLFGTGLSRAPENTEEMLVHYINSAGIYVIACDVPSGLQENGVAYPACVRADETVCMGLMKNALLLCDGADTAGDITVADIGIRPACRGAEVWDSEDVRAYFPKRKSNVNKGTFGSGCILAGGVRYGGSAFLAAGACLKSGAGYTRLCVNREHYGDFLGKLPACVLRAYSAVDGEILSSESIALGMGCGISERLYANIAELMTNYTGALVLDADALNTLAEFGVDILKQKLCRVIVTPHVKEFSRLTGKSVKETLCGAVEEAVKFAREYGVTVLLKNNRSVITDGERLAINTAGTPALAKGGSGDVLAGFLTGTLARGVPPFEAACASAYVLGTAGELTAQEMGEYAPDATDVTARISRVLMNLAQGN